MEFIDPGDIESDIKIESEEGFKLRREGKVKMLRQKNPKVEKNEH